MDRGHCVIAFATFAEVEFDDNGSILLALSTPINEVIRADLP